MLIQNFIHKLKTIHIIRLNPNMLINNFIDYQISQLSLFEGKNEI
jgi:hypothetical protein